MAAQPREMVVGNIVRRVLGLIRGEAKDERNDDNSGFSEADNRKGSPQRENSGLGTQRMAPPSVPSPYSPLRHGPSDASEIAEINGDDVFGARTITSRPPLMTSHTSYAVMNGVPVQQSMFNLLSATPSPNSTPPGTSSPMGKAPINPANLSRQITVSTTDLKAEIIEGIEEILDELSQVDEQIAGYALDHIHSNEIILTHTSSYTVQKFLLKAAMKRSFTVYHAEGFPNDHESTHATVTGNSVNASTGELSTEAFSKPLTAAGVKVVLIPDSAASMIMSRVNKVILATHVVIANGGLIAASGASAIAMAARAHRTPVIVLSGVYKLSPEYPFEFESLIEYGDPGKIADFADGDFVGSIDVENPLFDYVPPELVDLYITNL